MLHQYVRIHFCYWYIVINHLFLIIVALSYTYYSILSYFSGWSQIPPLGSSTPTTTAAQLNTLLSNAGEISSYGLLLIGYGAGGEIAQIYAYLYPTQIAGFGLIDSYSNLDRLTDLSTLVISKLTIIACGNLQISRALETCALIRPVSDVYHVQIKNRDREFIPSSQLDRYYSTETNGKYWAAQYNNQCVNKGAPTANTDYLKSVSLNLPPTSLLVSWPQLQPNIPVLIISAGNSITSTTAQGILFATQAKLYNETLSPTGTSKWVICNNCFHSFAYDKNSNYVANQINNYFSLYF